MLAYEFPVCSPGQALAKSLKVPSGTGKDVTFLGSVLFLLKSV